MFDNINLFIEKENFVEIAACEIGSLIGVNLSKRINNDGDNVYEAKKDCIYIIGYENHGLGNDIGLEFEKYNIKFGFGSHGENTSEGLPSLDVCLNYVLLCGDLISKKYRVDCMVTENVQAVVKIFAVGG